jgi:LacI family transcriptional regulator
MYLTAQQIKDLCEKHGSIRKAAKFLGLPESTVRSKINNDRPTRVFDSINKIQDMEAEIDNLKRRLSFFSNNKPKYIGGRTDSTTKIIAIGDTHDQPDLQDTTLLDMRAHLVRGYVLLGTIDSAQLAQFQNHREALLYVNRRPHGATSTPDDFVGIDNKAAGAAVATYFKQRGLQNCGLIHGALHSPATSDRVDGYTGTLSETGQGLNPRHIFAGQGLNHLQIGYDGITDLLQKGALPDALFCSSDLIAYGAHRKLSELGIQVPRDIVLMGFDDNPLNDWIAPWLNSVSVPYPKFGQAIVTGLEAIWNRGDRSAQILPFNIVERA